MRCRTGGGAAPPGARGPPPRVGPALSARILHQGYSRAWAVGAGSLRCEVDGPWLPLFAVLAGVLSFSSPCTLPLVPGYLGFMSGVSSSRGRTLGAAGLFVVGFSLVFTALGAGASTLGSLLLEHRLLLEKAAGVLIVLMGLLVLGLLRVPILMREGRPLM